MVSCEAPAPCPALLHTASTQTLPNFGSRLHAQYINAADRHIIMNGMFPSHVTPSFGEAVDHIEEWFRQWETNQPIAMDLWPTAQEDEQHKPVMSADLQEANEYLQGCSLHDLEDLQRRLGRVGVVTRVKYGDHAIVLTSLAENGYKSIAKEVQARYLRACGFTDEEDADEVDWRTTIDCMLAKIDQNCGASLDFRYIKRFSTPAFCTHYWKAEVHKRLWLRLRDIGFLMDAHCYYVAANETHHIVRMYRQAVYYGGHDFTREDRFRMSLEVVPCLDKARAPHYTGEELGHIKELLACLEDLQNEIQLPVPRPPQRTHVDDALGMELYDSSLAKETL